MMKTLMTALMALALPTMALAGGAELRRAEGTPQIDTITLGTGAAVEIFRIAISTNVRPDQKVLILQSLDLAYATNYVLISTWAATTDAQGWPLVGYAPLKLEVSSNVRLFVRKPTAFPTPLPQFSALSLK